MLGTHETIIKTRDEVLTPVLMDIQVSWNVVPVDIQLPTLRSSPPPLRTAHSTQVPSWTTLNLKGADSSATLVIIYKVYRASYPRKFQSSKLKSPNNLRWASSFNRYSPAPRSLTAETTRWMDSVALSHVNFIHYVEGTHNVSLHVLLLH
jgi:hypothetical protein